ncbi:TetR/AcrR family transcriptional regulator [Streptomyces sp. MN03-5084-2B]|nr:TetR/AcrR family transcriptional regulator [Streptomyces sp. MN03-5084-2B]
MSPQAEPGAGSKPKRSSGRRPSLTREEILAAALAIVDDGGLDALTMRAVADRLGVYPNAVHWHMGSRSGLIGAVSTKVFDEIRLPPQRDVPWPDWIRAMAREIRRVMRRHHHLAQVIGTQLVTTTGAMPFVERVLSVLTDAGFDDERLTVAYNSVIGFAIGWPALELSTEPTDQHPAWKDDFAAELAGLNPLLFPALTRAMPAVRNRAYLLRWDSGATEPLDTSFEFALDILVAGLGAQLPG